MSELTVILVHSVGEERRVSSRKNHEVPTAQLFAFRDANSPHLALASIHITHVLYL